MKHTAIWSAVPMLLLVIITVGCSSFVDDTDLHHVPVHADELNAALNDPRLLKKLGVEEVVPVLVEPYRVTVAEPGSTETLGVLYYTIQDGWHLKAENETFEFVPGEGWLIAEQ